MRPAGRIRASSAAWPSICSRRLEDATWTSPAEPVCGKHRPELYFDPVIRAGISSFADLCEPEEVREGLARLRADLDAGRHPVPAAEAEPPGDYVLLVASSLQRLRLRNETLRIVPRRALSCCPMRRSL